MSFQIEADEKRVWAARVVQLLHEDLRAAAEVARQRGVTRVEIAKKLGVNKSQVSRWLNSPKGMSLLSLGQLMWALDCDLARPAIISVGNVIAGAISPRRVAKEITEVTLNLNQKFGVIEIQLHDYPGHTSAAVSSPAVPISGGSSFLNRTAA